MKAMKKGDYATTHTGLTAKIHGFSTDGYVSLEKYGWFARADVRPATPGEIKLLKLGDKEGDLVKAMKPGTFKMRDLADYRHSKHVKSMRTIRKALDGVAWKTDYALGGDQVRRLSLGNFSLRTIKAAEKAFEDFGLALEYSQARSRCEAYVVEYRDAPEPKRVFVVNIPVHAYVEGWVEVPGDTEPENLDKAIAESLRKNGYRPETTKIPSDEVNLDTTVLDNWTFSTSLEAT